MQIETVHKKLDNRSTKGKKWSNSKIQQYFKQEVKS